MNSTVISVIALGELIVHSPWIRFKDVTIEESLASVLSLASILSLAYSHSDPPTYWVKCMDRIQQGTLSWRREKHLTGRKVREVLLCSLSIPLYTFYI